MKVIQIASVVGPSRHFLYCRIGCYLSGAEGPTCGLASSRTTGLEPRRQLLVTSKRYFLLIVGGGLPGRAYIYGLSTLWRAMKNTRTRLRSPTTSPSERKAKKGINVRSTTKLVAI